MFTHCVKYYHKNAVLRIYKYIKKEQKEGLILCPKKKLNMECYTFAEFCGLYDTEEP